MIYHLINYTGEVGQLLQEGVEVTFPTLPHVITKIQMDEGIY